MKQAVLSYFKRSSLEAYGFKLFHKNVSGSVLKNVTSLVCSKSIRAFMTFLIDILKIEACFSSCAFQPLLSEAINKSASYYGGKITSQPHSACLSPTRTNQWCRKTQDGNGTQEPGWRGREWTRGPLCSSTAVGEGQLLTSVEQQLVCLPAERRTGPAVSQARRRVRTMQGLGFLPRLPGK